MELAKHGTCRLSSWLIMLLLLSSREGVTFPHSIFVQKGWFGTPWKFECLDRKDHHSMAQDHLFLTAICLTCKQGKFNGNQKRRRGTVLGRVYIPQVKKEVHRGTKSAELQALGDLWSDSSIPCLLSPIPIWI